MTDIRIMSDGEIGKRLIWLEQEIDTCLECDLPITGLVAEIQELTSILANRNANWRI